MRFKLATALGIGVLIAAVLWYRAAPPPATSRRHL
jgi:hypothetical protein